MRSLIFLILITLTFTVQANDVSIDYQYGRTTGMAQSDNRNESLRKSFDENSHQLTINYERYHYLSYYGKILHYRGDSTADQRWDRETQQYEQIKKDKFNTSGTFFGAGIKLHTPLKKLISLGVNIGYGYLDNPDNILNSGKGQFNIGAEIVLSGDWRQQLVWSWQNISNGRQELGLGGKDSDYFPNHGRNFFSFGYRYRF